MPLCLSCIAGGIISEQLRTLTKGFPHQHVGVSLGYGHAAQLTMPNIGTIHDESSAGMTGRQSPLIHSSASPAVARTDPHRLLCKKPFMKHPRLQNANRSYRKGLFAARTRFIFLFQEPKHWMKQSIRQSLRPNEG